MKTHKKLVINLIEDIKKRVSIEPYEQTHLYPLKEKYDVIINTSCEHMYPMKKFRELNPNPKSWFCFYNQPTKISLTTI